MANWLEDLRDRVVVRSQVGKRKLDAVFTRRELDRKLADLGASLLVMLRQGRVVLPQEMASLVMQARQLEERLETQRDEIAALESEAV